MITISKEFIGEDGEPRKWVLAEDFIGYVGKASDFQRFKINSNNELAQDLIDNIDKGGYE